MLRPFQMLLCASLDYLAQHGVPKTPHQLDDHLAIRFRYPNSGKFQPWPLAQPGSEPDLRPRTALICNNMEALRGAVLAGQPSGTA